MPYSHSPASHPEITDNMMSGIIDHLHKAQETMKEVKKHIEGPEYERLAAAVDMLNITVFDAYLVRIHCVEDQLVKAYAEDNMTKIQYWDQVQRRLSSQKR